MHSAATALGRPSSKTLGVGRHRYPVILPKTNDPRLHLAAVIISLQVLGQVSFGFRLSIAQILISLATCAVLEMVIGLIREHAIIWPASALLTGNGVAFVLRVPGTQHGDWWSLRGGWIYCATAAVALLSKYVIRRGGRHIFNPSNLGLVACLLILGSSRVEPLDFWWGPMSVPLALSLAIIVIGGLAILVRLHLLVIAVSFWLCFAALLIPVAATGHGMTARWHLGPVSGFDFWWVLVTSPEILVFLFFMITDPKTVPAGRRARIAYGAAIATVAVLLLAPAHGEFGAKLAVLGALALVCPARALLERLGTAGWRALAPAATALAIASAAAVIFAVPPARVAATEAVAPVTAPLPPFTVVRSSQFANSILPAQARAMARDLMADLHAQALALERRDAGALGGPTAVVWHNKLSDALARARGGRELEVPLYDVARITLTLARRPGQGPPAIMATVHGSVVRARYLGRPAHEVSRSARVPLLKAFEIAKPGRRYVIVSDEVPVGWRPSA